jgi:hypothetical protein
MADLKLSDDEVQTGIVRYFFKMVAKYLVELPFKIFMMLVGETYKLAKWLFLQLCPKWLQPIVGIFVLYLMIRIGMDLYQYLSKFSFIDELTKAIVEFVTVKKEKTP